MVTKLVTMVDYTVGLSIQFNICFKRIIYVFQLVMYLIGSRDLVFYGQISQFISKVCSMFFLTAVVFLNYFLESVWLTHL